MASMNTVIEYVDSIKPNAYEDEVKYKWIAQVDGIVSTEVMDYEEPLTYQIPEDADKELLIKAPFDDIYALYVSAMIDFHNREYNDYNNTALVYADRMDAFRAWYIRNHAPKSHNFRHVMG